MHALRVPPLAPATERGLHLRASKCLYLYKYYLDPDFGFMHLRLQTCLPFDVQVCMNGREWLARQLMRHGLGFRMKRKRGWRALLDRIWTMLLAPTLANRTTAQGWTRLLRVSFVLGLIALATLAARRVDWRLLSQVFRNTRLPPVVAAALINLVQVACKSERWRLLLRHLRRIERRKLYYYLGVSLCLAIFVATAAGESLRIYLLRRRHGISVGPSFAVVAIEKFFDAIGLQCVSLVVLPFLLNLPGWWPPLIAAFAVGGGAVSATLVVLALRASRSGWTGGWARFSLLAPGVECVESRSTFVRASGWSLAAHLIDYVCIELVLTAVGFDLPWAAGGFLMVAFTIAMLIPLTPGHFGALEIGAVGTLQLLGAPIEKAVAFALVFHATQVASMIPFGLAGFGLLREARAEMAADSTA